MTPSNATDNLANSRSANVKPLGKLAIAVSARRAQASYLYNLSLIQFRRAAPLTQSRSVLRCAILHVYGLVSEEQVIRSNTRRIVAFMQHAQRRIWKTVVNFPGKSVGKNRRLTAVGFAHKPSISVSVSDSRPEPASVSFLNVSPKAILYRDRISSVTSPRSGVALLAAILPTSQGVDGPLYFKRILTMLASLYDSLALSFSTAISRAKFTFATSGVEGEFRLAILARSFKGFGRYGIVISHADTPLTKTLCATPPAVSAARGLFYAHSNTGVTPYVGFNGRLIYSVELSEHVLHYRAGRPAHFFNEAL
jgi:hypothetical protein